MASKVIFDSLRLLDEELVSLTAACKRFPVPSSRPAVERWTRKGSRGVILETILICGRRYTSVEAIDRFVRGQLKTEAELPPPKQGNMSKKAVTEAARRFGLPEPSVASGAHHNTDGRTVNGTSDVSE
jgi:hypothetical protein